MCCLQSNEWQGQRTFQNKCLHDTSTGSNPYIDAFQIISRTLSAFDDDERIPCYGFGDGKMGKRYIGISAGREV